MYFETNYKEGIFMAKNTKIEEFESFVEKCLNNISEDRAKTNSLLHSLLMYVIAKGNEERQKEYGPIASKYLESLQRSNEQLVKLTEIVRKFQYGSSDEFEPGDYENLIDQIQEEKNQKIEQQKDRKKTNKDDATKKE